VKAKTFLLVTLLLPYIVWVIAAIYSLILIWPLIYTVGLIPGVAQILGAIYGVGFAFVIGIVFWGVPYTVFAIIFFFWSKNKPVQKIYSTLLYSPMMLALMSSIGIMILGLAFRLAAGKIPSLEEWKNLGLISLLGAGLCLLYGYFFVGAGVVGYKLLKHLKLVKDNMEAS